MVLQLLPASAKAFAIRTKPNVVLNTRAETWLTQTLKRINRQKRPLNSVSQHRAALEDTLSADGALWLLASIMLPRAPKSQLLQDENPLIEALANYQLLQVEGYVVHIDMVSQHEVAFKLTQESIDSLVEYHKDIYCVDAAAGYTYDWPEKDKQLKKLQADFVQTVNSYVFRTHVRALEGLEDEGTGELLEGRSQEVKSGIEHLFHPLLPPPPKIIDVIAPHYMTTQYWSPQYLYAPPMQPYSQQQHYLTRPIEPWRTLGSSSPASNHSEPYHAPWSTSAYAETHISSPISPPSYSQPYTCSPDDYSTMPAMAPIQPLPLPSQLVAQQCSTSAGSGYGGGYWGGYNDMMTQYPISI